MITPSITLQNASTNMEILISPGGGNPDGSVFIQALNDHAPTRLQLQPTSGQPAQAPNCAAELTLSNTADNTNYGRLNFSSMTDGTYRIGQECGGTAGMTDVIFATESSGSSHVTPGTETYLKVDKNRVGDSQPFALVHGHIRFDVDNMGGDGSEPYIARGGGGNLTINGSAAGGVTLIAGSRPVLQTAGGIMDVTADVVSSASNTPIGYFVIQINGVPVKVPFYA